MARATIDQLLATVMPLNASALHLSAGQPPVAYHQGRLRRLAIEVFAPDDTLALMKSITPEPCQQQLQVEGMTTFDFDYSDSSRFRVCVFMHDGSVCLVLQRSTILR